MPRAFAINAPGLVNERRRTQQIFTGFVGDSDNLELMRSGGSSGIGGVVGWQQRFDPSPRRFSRVN
jgi:hypothetical protein